MSTTTIEFTKAEVRATFLAVEFRRSVAENAIANPEVNEPTKNYWREQLKTLAAAADRLGAEIIKEERKPFACGCGRIFRQMRRTLCRCLK